jgi:hypothetical protein
MMAVDPKQVKHLQAQYFDRIKPYVQMQAHILNLQPVRYRFHLTKMTFEREIMWDEASKHTYDMLEEVKEVLYKDIMRELGDIMPPIRLKPRGYGTCQSP